MASLWKRAIPSQYRMLRAIAGAVLNTCDAHDQPRDKIFARSVAKRAVGTLTAQWPDVLAATAKRRHEGLRDNVLTRKPKNSQLREGFLEGGRLSSKRRSPIHIAIKSITSKMIFIKKRSKSEYEMWIKVLRLLAQAKKEIEGYYDGRNTKEENSTH